ncbi:MAG: N-acetylmuramoyl-L-alanine amidase family protein, partial [Thermodesulfobacteriota bacterium]
RIVMDIEGIGTKSDTLIAKDQKKQPPPQYKVKDNIPSENVDSLRQALGLKIKTIVIDPGHGGHDPGATGPSGLKEKDVNLQIAKRLQEKLLQEGKNFGIENVFLTRSTDIFIPLEERTAIAKKKNADLFISIHCNAAKDKRAYGIETYILSFTNDKAALAVAARENAATSQGISNLKDIVQKYLLSSKIEESKKFAGYVQGAIISNVSDKYSNINNKGIKKAPFIVLIGADIPSILVETSFITNPEEEKRLKNTAYIDRIASGIISGIRKYADETQTAFAFPDDEYKL